MFDPPGHLPEHEQQDVDDIVMSVGMEPVSERGQGGPTVQRGTTGDALGSHLERLGGQAVEAPGGDHVGANAMTTEALDLAEAVQCQHDTGDRGLAGRASQRLQLGDGVLVADHQEALQAAALLGAELSGEEPPDSTLGTVAGTGAQSLEDAESREEHLVLHQPTGGEVDQLRRRVIAGPGTAPQPA